MIDLAVISASLAHDRVAEQFAAPRIPVRRTAVRILRAVADRPEPARQI